MVIAALTDSSECSAPLYAQDMSTPLQLAAASGYPDMQLLLRDALEVSHEKLLLQDALAVCVQ